MLETDGEIPFTCNMLVRDVQLENEPISLRQGTPSVCLIFRQYTRLMGSSRSSVCPDGYRHADNFGRPLGGAKVTHF